MLVKSAKVDGKHIEIHEDAHGKRRYWIKIDKLALFQYGRMRIRMFTTAEAAWKAALEEAKL